MNLNSKIDSLVTMVKMISNKHGLDIPTDESTINQNVNNKILSFFEPINILGEDSINTNVKYSSIIKNWRNHYV